MVETAEQAQAWIDHLLAERTLSGLLELRPAPGDVVHLRRRGEAMPAHDELDVERVRMISSIDREGRLHFRGAGQRAWPDTVRLLCRADEKGKQADAWRDQALAAASQRDRSSGIARSLSSHKWTLLEPWRVRDREVLERDIDGLRGVIETATDDARSSDTSSSIGGCWRRSSAAATDGGCAHRSRLGARSSLTSSSPTPTRSACAGG